MSSSAGGGGGLAPSQQVLDRMMVPSQQDLDRMTPSQQDLERMLRARIMSGELSVDFGDEDGAAAVGSFLAGAVSGHKLCNTCGKVDPPQRCGGCLRTAYCGRKCQKAHWPSHKAECAQFAVEGGETSLHGRILDRVRALNRAKIEKSTAARFRVVAAVYASQGRDAAAAESRRLHEADASPAGREFYTQHP